MDSTDDSVYTCTCAGGYSGDNCEKGEYMYISEVTKNGRLSFYKLLSLAIRLLKCISHPKFVLSYLCETTSNFQDLKVKQHFESRNKNKILSR